jgi:tRNA threonylcarbamoyladenosine biosynthesis protein TsaE
VVAILKIILNNEYETQQFAIRLSHCLMERGVVYLEGDLGAGKSTFARALIQNFGFERIKSPTYSLVETYQNDQIKIHHFDLYRLCDAEELEYIGIRDYSGIQLIEWASLGNGAISPADIIIELSGFDEKRTLTLSSHSAIGKALEQCLKG